MQNLDADFLITRTLELRAKNPSLGHRRLAQEISVPGWDYNKVRRTIEHAERKRLVPAGAPSNMLRYDVARQAIAEAVTFDEVRDWEDKMAAIKEYGRRIKDREMVINALELQARARRRRGELISSLEANGQIYREHQVPDRVLGPRIKLEDLGVTKNESSRDQKIAAVDGDSFERLIARCRKNLEDNPEKHAMDVLRAGPINGARSIMGDRQEPDDSLDYFPTPPWATRALMGRVFPHLGLEARWRRPVWEPACGEGHMADVLAEYGPVIASDVFDYGSAGYRRADTWWQTFDFLKTDSAPEVDCVITNPPFGDLSIRFVHEALNVSRNIVAMFFRSQWAVEGVERYESIFRDNPPTVTAFFVERVPICKGEWKPHGSTATAYCWLVWVKDEPPGPTFWIPPGCRESLTREDDIARFAPQYLDVDTSTTIDGETGEITGQSLNKDQNCPGTSPQRGSPDAAEAAQ
jgi:predicted RNA methylase